MPLATLKAALMGWPVEHSLSPALHGYWLHHYGIQGQYEALPVKPQDLPNALRSLPAKGLKGVNLTIPHKEAACALVDSLDLTAQRIGAVNLVLIDKEGRLQGRNTDAYGFSQNLLTSGFKRKKGAALVLGAGGAARAVLAALSDMGFSDIRIANRTSGRAEQLAQIFSSPLCKISVLDWQRAYLALDDVELLVNTTSLGMEGQDELLFPLHSLPHMATVADIVYAPLETSLLKAAKQAKHPTIDGLGMLLHQARPSFAAFFGTDPVVTEELRRFVLARKR